MGTLLAYSLTVSLIVLMLFPVLHQIVNRNTAFRFNRFAIIGGILLSLALTFVLKVEPMPSFESSVVDSIAISGSDLTIEGVDVQPYEAAASGENSFPWVAIAIVIYVIGIVLLLIREIVSFIRLLKIISQSDKTICNGYIICRLKDKNMAPFSWGNYIFLHDEAHDCVFLHEYSHTEKRHWIDVLFADLFCILLWYNPFAWMTRQLMKLNHEFEADSAVIDSGIDTYDYQRLLVIKAMGMRAIPLTNSFAADKRSFRKRVMIMSKKRSSKKTMLVALCALPAVLLAVIAISSPISAGLLDTISDYRFTDRILIDPNGLIPDAELSSSIEDQAQPVKNDSMAVIPSPLDDQTALANIIKLSLETIQVGKDTKVNIEIAVDENGYVKDVRSDKPEGLQLAEAIDKNLRGVHFEQTTDNGQPIAVHFNIPVQMKKSTIGKEQSDNTTGSVKNSLPEFIGGSSALNSFLIENIKTPSILSDEKQLKGRQTVNVNFTVDDKGAVRDVKVPISQGKALDDEAIRVISLTSGKWKPAVYNGIPTSCSLSIPITFSNI